MGQVAKDLELHSFEPKWWRMGRRGSTKRMREFALLHVQIRPPP